MSSEFVIKTRKGLVDLIDFKNQMNVIMQNQFADEMDMMDKIIVEVFNKHKGYQKNSPPLNSLGKMSAKLVLEKFT